MSGTGYSTFALDERLQRDSVHVLRLGLCELRLINDRRWPWVILIPQRPRVTEIHDLQPLDQAMLTFETNLVAATLKETSGCAKINSGSLGNIVSQLHVHVVGRNIGDPNWPGPVWGYGEPIRYHPEGLNSLVTRLRDAF
jgi:diadenosine tetraphosphate (Ap4A) HIT family hydrolase